MTPPSIRGEEEEAALEELERLAVSAGARVVGRVVQHRPAPDPGTYVGAGKVGEIAEIVRSERIRVLLCDDNLTPAQVQRLEKGTGARVVDRSELILDIFALGARTREAQLQVALAQALYTMPRLRRMWTHLERIEGGIGMRGPGEKQIEVDRRILKKSIQELKERIAEIGGRRDREIASRREARIVSLVGYTNAGKSTILRSLTGADVLIEDRLFSTLDTKVEAWPILPGSKVFITDTVGFIRKLPHHLVASFHATLRVVCHADLLLHVVDVSSPSFRGQIEAVRGVLEEIGADGRPTLLVLNKTDRLDAARDIGALLAEFPGAIPVSAKTGAGLEALRTEVRNRLAVGRCEARVHLSASDGKLAHYCHENTEVLARRMVDGDVVLDVRADERHLRRLRSLGAGVEIR